MLETTWRRINNRPFRKFSEREGIQGVQMDRHIKFLVAGMCLSTLFVYIR